MKICGQFRIWKPRPKGSLFPIEPDFILPNRVTDEGEQEYLKMIFQNVSAIAGGGNFYVGLCDQTPAEADLLSDISTEPGATGGYARKAILRSAAGWPTLTVVNGHTVLRSATITFAASGAAFDAAISRAFLTDQASGTGGKLYAYTGPLSAALTVPDGQNFQMQYEVFLD